MAISSPLTPKTSERTVKNLQGIILNKTKVSRETFRNKTILQDRRIENDRRSLQEEALEAPDIVRRPRGAAQLIAGSAKGFFERLMGFLGYLTAGWLLNNLPTWIAMGKEFIARTQQMGNLIGGFLFNTTKIFSNLTSLLGATLTNIMTFDFLDTSGRVGTAFEELQLSVDNWGTGFEDALKLITTPLTEGIASGEDARPLGTENTNEGAYETPPSSSGGDVSGYGTKEQQALLKTIRFAEGTAGSTGYSMFFGDKPEKSKYGDLTKLSANEVEKLVTKFLKDPQSRYGGEKSAAVGAYQIIDITLKARSLGMDMNRKFDQNFQDEMALRLAASKGVTSEVLKREGLSDSVIKKLSPEWASFPGNTYGQPTKRSQDLKSTYQSSLSSPTKSTGVSGISQSSLPPLPPTNTLSGGVQSYGASRDGGGRKHAGVDFDISGPNAKFYSRIGGVVTGGQFRYGADGRATDIYNKELGVYERIAEAARIVVKPGQVVNPGDLVAQGESGTGVIHYEIRKKIEGGFGNSLDPIAFLKNQKSQIAQTQPSPTQAQITPTGTPQNPQMSQSLAQERIGPTVIVSQNPSSPARQMMYSGGGGSSGGGSSQMSDFALLNNFIKNKLLLDLAYL